jgi:hypothetical protein
MIESDEIEKTNGRKCIVEEVIQEEASMSCHMVMRDLVDGEDVLTVTPRVLVARELRRYASLRVCYSKELVTNMNYRDPGER